MTTIRDVAERAQVSVGTVSRVINDHPSVNPAIRRVVLEAIEELRFRPNVVARNLATARTRTLGLLLSDLRNSELAAAAISGAEAVAQEHGYALLVADTQRDAAVEAQHLRSLLDRRVDGLLCAPVAGGTIRELVRAAGVPTVVFGRGKPDGSLPTAVLSFAAATEEAVEHLVEVGHRRVGIISRVPDFSIGAAAGLRAPDIRRSLRARNTEGGRAFDLRATSPAECTRLVQHLFADERRPTALFVNALYLIPATIMGVRAAGLSIPNDVSVIAYGDSDWSQVVEPPLNVIAADLVAHLQAAARLLVELIEQPYGPLPTIEHHGRYIRRGSVTSSPASRVASIDGVGRARLRSYG